MEEEREYLEFQGIKFYWHPFSKYYLASKCGKILSLKWNKKKILKFRKTGNNYLTFCLYENNKKRDYYIHRFVYECFKGEIPKGMHTDHCDNDKKNNQISNLQLLSHKENVRKSCCKKVISFNIENKEKKIFDSLSQAAEYYQISVKTVCHNCRKIIKTTKSKKDGKRFKFFYL